MFTEDILPLRITSAASVLADNRLGISSGYLIAARTTQHSIYGETDETVYVAMSRGMTPLTDGDFTHLRLDPLRRLLTLPENVPAQQVINELNTARVNINMPLAPLEALFVVALDAPYLDLIYPTALMTILSTDNAQERMTEIYGDTVAVVNSSGSVWKIAVACRDAVTPTTQAIAIPGYGVIVLAPDANAVTERIKHIVSLAESYLDKQGVDVDEDATQPEIFAPADVAAFRQRMSDEYEGPCIVYVSGLLPRVSNDMEVIAVTPSDTQYTTPSVRGRMTEVVTRTRLVFDRGIGLVTVGRSVNETRIAWDIASRTVSIYAGSGQLGSYSLRQPKPEPEAQPELGTGQFSGEVALVTGAASGIGKATTQVFLDRGAAVIGMDINPQIREMWPGEVRFLGLHGDVTELGDVQRTIREGVRAFGGIDIVFLNAGINEDHAPLEAFDTDLWNWVMRTNLDANAMILREIHSVLRHAPKGGRVIMNSSKSAVAPGAGSSSYTVSKMGLVQLARITALEWAKDGIRVYVVHPNAVFDTNIWKDNMAEKRAKHYGMTLEEYQRNNLLKVQIWSRDVGELVADLCGEHFAKTTGFQLPIDGGNDRVI